MPGQDTCRAAMAGAVRLPVGTGGSRDGLECRSGQCCQGRAGLGGRSSPCGSSQPPAAPSSPPACSGWHVDRGRRQSSCFQHQQFTVSASETCDPNRFGSSC